MASKRRVRKKKCEGKSRYPTEREADRHCYQDDIKPYLCPFCGNWHVGHRPGGKWEYMKKTGLCKR